MPFFKKTYCIKLQIIKDGRPCPPLPNAKGTDKDSEKTVFNFEQQKPMK